MSTIVEWFTALPGELRAAIVTEVPVGNPWLVLLGTAGVVALALLWRWLR